MYLLLTAVCLGCLIVSLLLNKKEIASPSVLFSGSFLLVSIFAVIGKASWNKTELSVQAFAYLATGIITFVAISCLIRGCYERRLEFKSSLMGIQRNKSLDNWDFDLNRLNTLLVFVAFSSAFYCFDVVRHLKSYGYPVSSFSEIASGYHELGFSFGIAARSQVGTYCYIFSYCAALVFALISFLPKAQNIRFKCLVGVLLGVPPLAITGLRTYVGHLLISIIVMKAVLDTNKGAKEISLLKLVLVIMMGIPVLATVFDALLDVVGRSTDLELNSVDYLGYYIGVGIPGFSSYLAHGLPSMVGIDELFSAFHKNLYQFGLAQTPGSNSSLVFLEGASNVYTVFKTPYHDFGFLGIVVYSAFLAFVFTWLYESAKTPGKKYSLLFYSLLSFILIESVRDDFLSYWFGLNLLYYAVALISISVLLKLRCLSFEEAKVAEQR